MSEGYLDNLEVIKDYSFNAYPIYELAMLLASDLNSARVISITNQEDYDDIELKDLLSNESYCARISPHVKDIANKIVNSIQENEIKPTYLMKNFETGNIDINNTLISFHEFNIFLDIYDLQQHIIWSEDDSLLGLRVEQEHKIYNEALDIIRENKQKVSNMVTKAEWEELYKDFRDTDESIEFKNELREKVKDDPIFLDFILTQNFILNRNLKNSNNISITTDKPLNVRTENNYLRLIYSLANGISGFNPKRPFEAAQLIKDEIDIDLSQETIASYISKAFAIESKKRD